MTDDELLLEAERLQANRPRISELRKHPERNHRWLGGELGGKATPDQLPLLAAAFEIGLETLQDWIGLAAKVEPELRGGMSWAALRALTRRRDWRKLARPGLSEREARRLAGGKASNLSVKERSDRIERWWRDVEVRNELRSRQDLARNLRARLDYIDEEDQRELRRLTDAAEKSRKGKTPDAAIDALAEKLLRTSLELETAVAYIRDNVIMIYTTRREEFYKLFDRLGNAGYDGMEVLDGLDGPPPADPNTIVVDPNQPRPGGPLELGPGD